MIAFSRKHLIKITLFDTHKHVCRLKPIPNCFLWEVCMLAGARATFTPAETEADHMDRLRLEWCTLLDHHGSVVKVASTTTDRGTSVRGRTYTSATACEVSAADISTVLDRGTTVTRHTAMDHQYTIVLTRVLGDHTWWWTETRRLSVT